MGCWRRRSITFADGREDASSDVIWLQTAADYGDLRIPANRIDLSHRESLADCTVDELVALSASDQQSSAGVCTLTGRQAVWRGRMRFHVYDAWPEPGELRRVGPCLIEFAPSGDYVEDWRLQPASAGFWLSLALSEERVNGAGTGRQGIFVQAGNHAMLILDRLYPPPRQAALAELVDEYRHDALMLARLLDLECSYAVRKAADAPFIIERSTLPFREGQALPTPQRRSPTEWAQPLESGERLWRLRTWRAGK